MKTKLLTLLTLLVCVCTGAWAANPVDPSASNFTAVKNFAETALIWTDPDDFSTWGNGWVVCGKSSDRTTFSKATSKNYFLTL